MKSTVHSSVPHSLTLSEAIILQQVHHHGEDDTRTLARLLGMSREHTLGVVTHLKKKGLIAVDGDDEGVWIHLTRKGQRLIRYLWPATPMPAV